MIVNAAAATASVEQFIAAPQAVEAIAYKAPVAAASVDQFIVEPQAVLATRVSDTLTQFAKLATDLSDQYGVQQPSELEPAEGQRYFAPKLSQKLDKTIQMALALEQLLLERKTATSVQPTPKPKVLDVVSQDLSLEDFNNKIKLRRIANGEDNYKDEESDELFMSTSNFRKAPKVTIESLNRQLDSVTKAIQESNAGEFQKGLLKREQSRLNNRINILKKEERPLQAKENNKNVYTGSVEELLLSSKPFTLATEMAREIVDTNSDEEDLNDWSED